MGGGFTLFYVSCLIYFVIKKDESTDAMTEKGDRDQVYFLKHKTREGGRERGNILSD